MAEDERTPTTTSKTRARNPFFRLFPSIMLPMFISVMDQTIVATALPDIAVAFGSAEQVSWVVIVYLLVATVSAPVYGRLGDVWGRRPLMIGCLILVIAASVACAMATSFWMLLVARGFQALGGGGLMTLSHAMIGDAVPPADRARYQGFLATVGVSANTFGPVAGGYITEHWGWPFVFLVNMPIAIAALTMVLLFAPRMRMRPQRFRFDVLGLVLFATGVVTLLLALKNVEGFDARSLLLAGGLAAVAACAFVLLVRQERRASFPLLPLDLLSRPTIWRSDALAACQGAILISLITFMPIYLRVVQGVSPADTGLLLLPMTVGTGMGSLLTGQAISFTGRTAIYPSLGFMGVVLFTGTIAIFAASLSAWHLAALLALNAFCIGSVMATVQVMVQTAAGSGQLGAAAGSVQFSRSIGAALGTAVIGSVLFAVLALQGGVAQDYLLAVLGSGPSALSGLDAGTRADVHESFGWAFQVAFGAVALVAALGAALAWTVPDRRL
jgi:EmrB/QacA subfamily drug resistance transporter